MTDSSETDDYADFIRRIRAGDAQAAEEVVRRFEREIRLEVRTCLRLRDARLRRVFDSMDVCQSVLASFFVRASVGEFDLDEPSQLIRLLVGMARHKLSDQVKHHQRRRRDIRRVGVSDPAEAHTGVTAETPSQLIAGKELLQMFRERLSEEELQVADLRSRGHDWAFRRPRARGNARRPPQATGTGDPARELRARIRPRARMRRDETRRDRKPCDDRTIRRYPRPHSSLPSMVSVRRCRVARRDAGPSLSRAIGDAMRPVEAESSQPTLNDASTLKIDREPATNCPSGRGHDLRDVLAERQDLDEDGLLDLFCNDQVDRWCEGVHIPAEAYLALHPALDGDREGAFDLIYGEYVLRESLGEAPTPQEYFWRFPRFAERFRRQLDLHKALRGRGTPGATPIRPGIRRPTTRTARRWSPGPTSPGIGSWACWATAAWAWSTRPGT